MACITHSFINTLKGCPILFKYSDAWFVYCLPYITSNFHHKHMLRLPTQKYVKGESSFHLLYYIFRDADVVMVVQMIVA